MQRNQSLPSMLTFGELAHHFARTSEDVAQQQVLRLRAYSPEGKREDFIAKVPARVRPPTIARLNLFATNPSYGFPIR